MSKRLFTSESVTEGHPDKIADAISDAILDSLLSQDSKSRVAVETLITTGQVHVAGEVTTNGYADVMNIVRETVLNIGYDSSDKGFDGNSCGVSLSIGQQSSDIAQGVDSAFEKRVTSSADPLDLQGAGDQGLMFGYACDETPQLMPLPIYLSHRLVERQAQLRKNGLLRPTGGFDGPAEGLEKGLAALGHCLAQGGAMFGLRPPRVDDGGGQALLIDAQTQSGRSVGRPQVARAMVVAGHVRDVREAFDRWLGGGLPGFIRRDGAPSEAVIEVIHQAGGLASIAHPGKSMSRAPSVSTEAAPCASASCGAVMAGRASVASRGAS